MKRRLIALICGTLLGAGAGLANAATLTYTASYGDISAIPATYVIPWSQTLNVTQFDSSLGTLNSIHLILSGNLKSTSTIENPVSSPPTSLNYVNASTTAAIELLNPYDNSTQLMLVTPTVTASGSVADGATVTLNGTSSQSVSTDLISTSAGFSNFIGNSTVALLTDASGLGGGSFGAGLVFTVSGLADETVTVTYNYDEIPPSTVPEPGTFLLLGAGLLGAGAFIRLRKKG